MLFRSLEYGAIALKLQPIRLANIFSRLAEFTRHQAANKNLSLIIDIPSPEIIVFTDAERCLQGLVMLIDTAIESIETGSIKVAAAIDETANFAQITIDLIGEISLWDETDKTELELPVELTLLSIKISSKKPRTSPYLKLLLVQSLFEIMGGNWQILEADFDKFIQLQGLIRLAK